MENGAEKVSSSSLSSESESGSMDLDLEQQSNESSQDIMNESDGQLDANRTGLTKK
jgi:hypothetical protein